MAKKTVEPEKVLAGQIVCNEKPMDVYLPKGVALESVLDPAQWEGDVGLPIDLSPFAKASTVVADDDPPF